MDVEDDAGSMSLNDLIKKYYGLMGLTAQEIKKIYYRVNESVNEESEEKEEVKSLRDTVHDIWNQAAQDEEKREDDAKWLKTEEKKSITEEKIKCPNCGHMNDADAHKCSNCGASLNSKSEDKDGKKKAMTGSPATKVDTTPEVEYDK
jgi:DNA-directed RNA polymerase subunit RPC12/RpoP